MTTAKQIRMYEIIKGLTDEKEATEFVEGLQDAVKETQPEIATKKDLAEVKADLIKWMFIFWIGQVIATFGLILLFIKK